MTRVIYIYISNHRHVLYIIQSKLIYISKVNRALKIEYPSGYSWNKLYPLKTYFVVFTIIIYIYMLQIKLQPTVMCIKIVNLLFLICVYKSSSYFYHLIQQRNQWKFKFTWFEDHSNRCHPLLIWHNGFQMFVQFCWALKK